MRVDRILGESGIKHDDFRGRKSFARRMEELRQEEADAADYVGIRRGWRFGSEEFVSRMLERVSEISKTGDIHSQREVAEGMNPKAIRIIAEGLKEAGWKAGDLRKERKGHPVKVRIAETLRRETTKTLKWIAEELHMGTWTHVSHLLYHSRTKGGL